MKNLTKILIGLVVVLNCAWSFKDRTPQSCTTCDQAEALYTKIVDAKKAYEAKLQEHKLHNVIAGPFQEMSDYELAQGEAFRLICDQDRNTYNDSEKAVVLQFVLDLNQLRMNSDAMSDINSCFRVKVLRARAKYTELANKIEREGELNQFIVMNGRFHQDDVK